MPELPEVETTRKGLEPLLGGVLKKAQVFQSSLRWPIDVDFERLTDQQLLSIERRAKYLILRFERAAILLHLGMSGSLRLEPVNTQRLKHDHVVLEFGLAKSGDPLALHYHDPRRFGSILTLEANQRLLDSLGPEPLSDDFNATSLLMSLGKTSRPIKTTIMDQKVVVGVGNIYATEALFLAGISPLRPAYKLTLKEVARFVDLIKQVITKAIELGGSTLRDYRGVSGETGYFQQTLLAYGRAGEPCVNCGHQLINERIAQRASVYCLHCQK
jgi:formamidopyrimidine-DNA glycosylase